MTSYLAAAASRVQLAFLAWPDGGESCKVRVSLSDLSLFLLMPLWEETKKRHW